MMEENRIMDDKKWVTGDDIRKNKINKGCPFKLSLCSKLCILWDDENQTCLIRRLIVSLLKNEEIDDNMF